MPTHLDRVSAYVTKEEKQRIKNNACFYGFSVSKFLTVTASRDKLPITVEERKLLFQIIFEIKKAGNNLNQISKALHHSFLFDTHPPSGSEINLAIQEFRLVVQKLAERF
jgi:hypothetical protein